MPSIASSKRFCHSRKRGPGNETLKKRKEQTAFYDRFQPSASPGKKGRNVLIGSFFSKWPGSSSRSSSIVGF